MTDALQSCNLGDNDGETISMKQIGKRDKIIHLLFN